jgi:hypothetical protein
MISALIMTFSRVKILPDVVLVETRNGTGPPRIYITRTSIVRMLNAKALYRNHKGSLQYTERNEIIIKKKSGRRL